MALLSIREHRLKVLKGYTETSVRTGIACVCGKEYMSSDLARTVMNNYGQEEQFCWCEDLECSSEAFIALR